MEGEVIKFVLTIGALGGYIVQMNVVHTCRWVGGAGSEQ